MVSGRRRRARSATDADRYAIARVARYTLAIIRIVNGALGLGAPSFIIERFGEKPGDSAAAVYGLRLFGIRTVVLGLDLATQAGPALGRTAGAAVLIHASDTATVASLGLSGRLTPRTALPLLVISALNTALALMVWQRYGDRRPAHADNPTRPAISSRRTP